METCIPKGEGVRILVVGGALKGQRAKLMSRQRDKESCTIQLMDDFDLHTVSLDDVSEYIGESDEMD